MSTKTGRFFFFFYYYLKIKKNIYLLHTYRGDKTTTIRDAGAFEIRYRGLKLFRGSGRFSLFFFLFLFFVFVFVFHSFIQYPNHFNLSIEYASNV